MRDFEQSLPMALLRAREGAMARFRPMLREHGLTEQQWRVIRALSAYPDIDAGELAQRSLLLGPSLTRILQFLEREKLIKRSVDAADQRRAEFRLTSRGERLFDKVAPHSERLYAEMTKEFGREKLELLYDLLAEFSVVLAPDSEVLQERDSNSSTRETISSLS